MVHHPLVQLLYLYLQLAIQGQQLGPPMCGIRPQR
jgi:hypothetical protein